MIEHFFNILMEKILQKRTPEQNTQYFIRYYSFSHRHALYIFNSKSIVIVIITKVLQINNLGMRQG